MALRPAVGLRIRGDHRHRSRGVVGGRGDPRPLARPAVGRNGGGQDDGHAAARLRGGRRRLGRRRAHGRPARRHHPEVAHHRGLPPGGRRLAHGPGPHLGRRAERGVRRDEPADVTAIPRWTAARVAHPVRDLARSAAFYGELLQLPRRGGFTAHDGYDGAFFVLPGGTELELTTGPSQPAPGTDDDLLVLYLGTPDDVQEAAGRLAAAGVGEAPAGNPYWERWGRTFRDPDGYRVVLAARDRTDTEPLHVELHDGPRAQLRPSFELAEDSATELDSYLDEGLVLVAVTASGDVVGHLQLIGTEDPAIRELKSLAVRPDLQGRGVGARLVEAAVDLLTSEDATLLVVSTAAASTGNVRFYQRQGFRMRAVDRDAFPEAAGYPPGIEIDGIELRDRVWLDRPIGPGRSAG